MNSRGILGNSIDIKVDCYDPSVEIRADVRVDEFDAKRIWGQVLNCDDQPIPNSLVKLVKVTCVYGKKTYEGIAHTVTDCEGFYQFDICCEEEDMSCYKIIVNKAVTGPETIIDTNGGNCGACGYAGPCNPNGGYPYDPCKKYPPVVKPYQPNECNCLPVKPVCGYPQVPPMQQPCYQGPVQAPMQQPCYQGPMQAPMQQPCYQGPVQGPCTYTEEQKHCNRTNYASYTK